MIQSKFNNIFLCPLHGEGISVKGNIVSCDCKEYKVEDDQIVVLNEDLVNIPATLTRDKQAKGYLEHNKHLTHTYILQKWIDNIPNALLKKMILDLGCGPGPTPRLLLERGGMNIFSVDFSIESLRINRINCNTYTNKPIYLLEDIRKIRLKKNSISILLMTDFLQHIVNKNERDIFLKEAFDSLIPGGYYYLSFLNINIKNYFKGDIYGEFSSGSILYERLSCKNVIDSFPENITVDNIIPLNISNNILLDSMIRHLPFSRLLSRWIVVQGRKIPDDN
jgi:SAM-dependent methyltransferase